jgi:hypothetical protein
MQHLLVTQPWSVEGPPTLAGARMIQPCAVYSSQRSRCSPWWRSPRAPLSPPSRSTPDRPSRSAAIARQRRSTSVASATSKRWRRSTSVDRRPGRAATGARTERPVIRRRRSPDRRPRSSTGARRTAARRSRCRDARPVGAADRSRDWLFQPRGHLDRGPRLGDRDDRDGHDRAAARHRDLRATNLSVALASLRG